jgi:hypothetical protein
MGEFPSLGFSHITSRVELYNFTTLGKMDMANSVHGATHSHLYTNIRCVVFASPTKGTKVEGIILPNGFSGGTHQYDDRQDQSLESISGARDS